MMSDPSSSSSLPVVLSSFKTTIGVDVLPVFCTLSGVVAFLSCVYLALLGAWTCCSSTVSALLTVALVLGVALGASST